MPWSPSRRFKLEELNRDERYLMLPISPPIPLRLFAITLLQYVDGAGREVANSSTLREAFYEFDQDVTTADVNSALIELESRGWLLQYISGQRVLLQMNPVAMSTFLSHRDSRDTRFPPPEPGPEFAQRVLWGDSGPTVAEGKGEGDSGGGSEGVPPWMLDPELPPPRGCVLHPVNTGLIKCGACAGARDIHTQFMSGEITHEQAVAAWRG